MQDQKGVESEVSQEAVVCGPLWPLNEELWKLTASAPFLCPQCVPGRLGGRWSLPGPACPQGVYIPSELWDLVLGSMLWSPHEPRPPSAG